MLLNNQWVTEETKVEIKRKWKHNDTKFKEHSKNSSMREVYSNTSLPQETRKISNRQPNLTPKATRERRTNKTQS